jgi:hypothetical protein
MSTAPGRTPLTARSRPATRSRSAASLPLSQSSDIRNQGGFFADVHEDTFDHLVMIDQQQQDEIDRSFKLPETEAGSAAAVILPAAAQRAGKFFAFDSGGNPIASSGSLTGVAVESVGQVVQTIAALRALAVPSAAVALFALGYYAALDGGGGKYIWDAASVAADDGGSVIRPNAAPTAGRWRLDINTSVSVRQFGAKGDMVNDDSGAFRNAGLACSMVDIPQATTGYTLNTEIVVSKPTVWRGVNGSAVPIYRGYNPANPYNGIFRFTDGSSYSGLRQMTLRSRTGQNAGCLMSIKPTAAGNVGIYYFEDVDFTVETANSHDYAIWMDGTPQNVAPIGIRGVVFNGCHVFGANVAGILWKGIISGCFLGGGMYPAGGTSTKSIIITGDATVNSYYTSIFTTDILGDVDLDYATYGSIHANVFGAGFTNTANVNGFTVTGRLPFTVMPANWLNSSHLDPAKIKMDGNGLEVVNAYNTGSTKSGATTKVGHVGKTFAFAVNDTKTFTLTMDSAKLIKIATGGGAAALFFGDYKTAAMTILSNPAGEFENSNAPAAGHVGVYKAANSHDISVKNGTGGLVNLEVMTLGFVSATTDPV